MRSIRSDVLTLAPNKLKARLTMRGVTNYNKGHAQHWTCLTWAFGNRTLNSVIEAHHSGVLRPSHLVFTFGVRKTCLSAIRIGALWLPSSVPHW
jgi:hypothetical protein